MKANSKAISDGLNKLRHRVGRLDGADRDITMIPPNERHRMLTDHIVRWLDAMTPDERATFDADVLATLADPERRRAAYRGETVASGVDALPEMIRNMAVSEVMKNEASGRALPTPAPWWSRYLTEDN